jgi:hypothetical protein
MGAVLQIRLVDLQGSMSERRIVYSIFEITTLYDVLSIFEIPKTIVTQRKIRS